MDATITTVSIVTSPLNERPIEQSIEVGSQAQRHVLRSFNPKEYRSEAVGAKVDMTKTLCAALIQQMINLQNNAQEAWHTDDGEQHALARAQYRAAERAIEMVETVQMQLVKANFAQA